MKWKNFEVVAGGASFQDGMAVLPADPAALWNKTASVMVTSIHHHGLAASVDVPVRYDCSYTASYNGDWGRDGADGQIGSGGDDGVDKQSSESYAEPGGHGGHGGQGGNGSDGEQHRREDHPQNIRRKLNKKGQNLKIFTDIFIMTNSYIPRSMSSFFPT